MLYGKMKTPGASPAAPAHLMGNLIDYGASHLSGRYKEAVCISHWHHFLLVEILVISIMLSSFRQTEVHINLASQLLFFPLMSLHLAHCTLPLAGTTISTEYLLPPVHLQGLRCCNFYFVNTQHTCHIVMLKL